MTTPVNDQYQQQSRYIKINEPYEPLTTTRITTHPSPWPWRLQAEAVGALLAARADAMKPQQDPTDPHGSPRVTSRMWMGTGVRVVVCWMANFMANHGGWRYVDGHGQWLIWCIITDHDGYWILQQRSEGYNFQQKRDTTISDRWLTGSGWHPLVHLAQALERPEARRNDAVFLFYNPEYNHYRKKSIIKLIQPLQFAFFVINWL